MLVKGVHGIVVGQSLGLKMLAFFASRFSLMCHTTMGTALAWTLFSHVLTLHDDAIKWKHFPRYWPFVRGIHWPPVNSPHKRQGRGALIFIPPPTTKLLGGYTGFTPSVRPSVRMPCPLCIIYSYGWILFILGTNDHYYERVCRAPWPLTLTYIFKVIWPWLRKSCPLCSV